MKQILITTLIIFLASCSQPQKVSPLKIAMGTCNCIETEKGTVLLAEFSFEQSPPAETTIKIKGPIGWNENKIYEEATPWLVNEPGTYLVPFLLRDIPALSGTYAVEAEIEGVIARQTTTVDVFSMLPKPENLESTMSIIGADAKWDAVAGAELYEAKLFEESISLGRLSFYWTRVPSVPILVGVAREGFKYYVTVDAYNYDFWEKTGVPQVFNVSSEFVEAVQP
jgi:hypothetical protein